MEPSAKSPFHSQGRMFYLHDAVPVMYVHRRQSIEANLDDISREGSMPNAMTTDPHGHCAGLSLGVAAVARR